ncbi:hypothetical protein BDN71DRAFT_1429562 [Pleurotus eryngii]|uniref:Uncharacterized protein n=1 Tax=Pleurotus eryngii TaxID=5323 RepID=A0A9P6A543_PLEER|nr:hypothetical protein BDN71DRAFT_1429562 [Pleurotus eryngii]
MDNDKTIMAELDMPTYNNNDPLALYNAQINSKILVALHPWESVLTLPPELWSNIAEKDFRRRLNLVSMLTGGSDNFGQMQNLNVSKHLLSITDSMRNNEQSYAPILSMIQSSSMGKTRVLYKIGKKQIVIYCCFRKDNADPTSYPPHDVALHNYLLKALSPQNKKQLCEAHIQAMFYSLFNSVLAVINLVKRDNGISPDTVICYFQHFGSSENFHILIDNTQGITPMVYLAIQSHFETLFNNPIKQHAFYNFVCYKYHYPNFVHHERTDSG